MQKDVDFEVIVVNDIEEEDETDAIREKFPEVIYIKDSKIQGPSNKHKAGLKIAKGEYLYMPDDDDYLIDDHFLRRAIDILDLDPQLAFVSGQCKIGREFFDSSKNYFENHTINVRGRVLGKNYLQEFQNKLEKPRSTVSAVFRKEAICESNICDMIEMSDSSIYMQCLLRGDAYIIDDIVAVYRVHEKSLTSNASLPFIMNVLHQKELFYKKSIGIIPRPKDFWSTQYSKTFSLFSNKRGHILEKVYVLFWGLLHSHGSVRLNLFVLRSLLITIVHPRY